MRLLLDTCLLLWVAGGSPRVSRAATDLLQDDANDPMFSAASLWEIAIKQGLGRADFRVDAAAMRRRLLENTYRELPITSAHATLVAHLPNIHRDPFDRLLIAQAKFEDLTLLTADATLARYGGNIRLV